MTGGSTSRFEVQVLFPISCVLDLRISTSSLFLFKMQDHRNIRKGKSNSSHLRSRKPLLYIPPLLPFKKSGPQSRAICWGCLASNAVLEKDMCGVPEGSSSGFARR